MFTQQRTIETLELLKRITEGDESALDELIEQKKIELIGKWMDAKIVAIANDKSINTLRKLDKALNKILSITKEDAMRNMAKNGMPLFKKEKKD